MRVIRKNVFETNSSSVHSLVIDKSGLEPSKFELNKDGALEVNFGSFGKDFEVYSTQYEKLSYLMTCIYYLSGYDMESIYDNYNFKQIEEVICEYTGATRIIVNHDIDPYIDHQSIPSYDIEIINVYDEDELLNFVFSKYISLQTRCD